MAEGNWNNPQEREVYSLGSSSFIVRRGSIVTVKIGTTETIAEIIAKTVPASMRPANNILAPTIVVDNNTSGQYLGTIYIYSSGAISFNYIPTIGQPPVAITVGSTYSATTTVTYCL